MRAQNNSHIVSASGAVVTESHRVYYCPTNDSSNQRGMTSSHNNNKNMTSTAIRLSYDIPSSQVLFLLRQKFGLPIPKVDRIAAKLQRLPSRNKNVKNKDSLVLVASSSQFVLVQFPQEDYNHMCDDIAENNASRVKKGNIVDHHSTLHHHPNMNDFHPKNNNSSNSSSIPKFKPICGVNNSALNDMLPFSPKKKRMMHPSRHNCNKSNIVDHHPQPSSSSLSGLDLTSTSSSLRSKMDLLLSPNILEKSPASNSNNSNNNMEQKEDFTEKKNGNESLSINGNAIEAEPFHIVRTVLPHEYPLNVRNQLQSYLQKHYGINNNNNNDTNAPTLRWFFVPHNNNENNNNNSRKSNHLPLDGYCTTVEHESDDDDDDEYDNFSGGISKGTMISNNKSNSNNNNNSQGSDDVEMNSSKTRISWKEKFMEQKQPNIPVHYNSQYQKLAGVSNNNNLRNVLRNNNRKQPRNWTKERHLAHVLLSNQNNKSMTGNISVSGYLSRQSHVDPNVWKRVFCILSDFQLWILGRVRNFQQNIGRINVLHLRNATLIEHEQTGILEIMTGSNNQNWKIRPQTQQHYVRWVEALSLVIVQAHESHVLEMADLLIAEESLARSKRVDRDWLQNCCQNKAYLVKNNERINHWLRFGWLVMEYKETCRHVQNLLSTSSNPVVVVTATSRRKTRTGMMSNKKHLQHNILDSQDNEVTHQLFIESIQYAWTAARQVWKYSHRLYARNHHLVFLENQKKIQTFLEREMPPPLLLSNEEQIDLKFPPIDLFNELLQTCMDLSQHDQYFISSLEDDEKMNKNRLSLLQQEFKSNVVECNHVKDYYI